MNTTINGIKITDQDAAEAYAIEVMGKDAQRRFVDIAYSQWFNKLKAEYSISTDSLKPKTIKPNTTISARSIGDYDCIFTAKVIDRKGNYVTLDIRGEVIRKKVKKDYEGNEYVMVLGTYSMAPMFR